MPLALLVHLHITLVEMNAIWGLPHPSRMTSYKRESSNLASLNLLYWPAEAHSVGRAGPGSSYQRPLGRCQDPGLGGPGRVTQQVPPTPCPPWRYPQQVPNVALQFPVSLGAPDLHGTSQENNLERINESLTCCHFRKVADHWLDASLWESTVKKCLWADVFASCGFLRPLACIELERVWKTPIKEPDPVTSRISKVS